ncbi:MAG TPA: dTDP-4-dehydrorhamnose 3,5-epimerase [Thermoanaerobaculia bacterium]|nr:dTDP-4-dehydrorhamnose 3,5-epimerase [Thermoanaerobaculia bacterium]
MIFTATALPGVFVLAPERHADERGFFVRTYDRDELAAHGLDPTIAQGNLSFNHRRGTLRGLHFQAAPYAEAKLVRCSRGAIFDVVVDVRPGSPTRGRHVSVTLSADDGRQVYVPAGFAHGFQTLLDATEVSYQISAPFSAAHGRGFRYDDPTLAIPWPEPVTVISARDRELPRFPVE